MDWEYAIYRLRLAHIFALLFSLAEMAEIAAVASPRRRRELIHQLLRGEAAGLRVLSLSDVADDEVTLDGINCDPDEARRLAVSLRALAIWIYILERLGAPPDDPGPLYPPNMRLSTALWPKLPAALPAPVATIPIIDTS